MTTSVVSLSSLISVRKASANLPSNVVSTELKSMAARDCPVSRQSVVVKTVEGLYRRCSLTIFKALEKRSSKPLRETPAVVFKKLQEGRPSSPGTDVFKQGTLGIFLELITQRAACLYTAKTAAEEMLLPFVRARSGGTEQRCVGRLACH